MERVGFLLLGISALIGALSWSYKEVAYLHMNLDHYEECVTYE